MQFTEDRMRKFINTLVVGAILSCYYFLPLAAPFIVLYFVGALAWLFRQENRVSNYVELDVAHPHQ